MGRYEEQIKSLEENINSITKNDDDWHVLCRLDHNGVSFPIKVTPDILEEFDKNFPSQDKLRNILPFVKKFNFANNTFIMSNSEELRRGLYVMSNLIKHIASTTQNHYTSTEGLKMLSLPKVLLLSFKI